MKNITTGSDFSGVGAFDYAIERVCKEKGLNHKRIYACDWDKYARITYMHNHGEPDYYPKDVYDREIPKESLDIYMTSPPCQAFSVAGKRKGKDDERGILFFNSHDFIQQNKPRFFIFENVRGLLSDNNGQTFQEWVNMLGGKSVNGVPVLFPHEDSVPYHLYWKVLNSKNYGVPQNRERVFLIGIRDDSDNVFQFPKEEYLVKKLKDVLEDNPNNIYNLSKKGFEFVKKRDGKFCFIDPEIARTLTASGNLNWTGNFISVDEKYFLSEKIFKQLKKHPKSRKFIDVGKYDKEILQSIKQDVCTAIDASYYKGFGVRQGKCRQVVESGGKIRRLTPRECFRLQDFPESFDYSVVSDSQAYKQAGNSITVRVLELILSNLPL